MIARWPRRRVSSRRGATRLLDGRRNRRRKPNATSVAETGAYHLVRIVNSGFLASREFLGPAVARLDSERTQTIEADFALRRKYGGWQRTAPSENGGVCALTGRLHF